MFDTMKFATRVYIVVGSEVRVWDTAVNAQARVGSAVVVVGFMYRL